MFHYVKCTFCNTKIVFLLALIIFGVIVYGGYNSDIKQHVYFIKKL